MSAPCRCGHARGEHEGMCLVQLFGDVCGCAGYSPDAGEWAAPQFVEQDAAGALHLAPANEWIECELHGTRLVLAGEPVGACPICAISDDGLSFPGWAPGDGCATLRIPGSVSGRWAFQEDGRRIWVAE